MCALLIDINLLLVLAVSALLLAALPVKPALSQSSMLFCELRRKVW